MKFLTCLVSGDLLHYSVTATLHEIGEAGDLGSISRFGLHSSQDKGEEYQEADAELGHYLKITAVSRQRV